MSLLKSLGRYAITCPGQGIVRAGLVAPYTKYRIKPYLDEIDAALGERFSQKLLDPQNSEYLLRTSNAQPAILATTYIITKALGEHFGELILDRCSFICGHSLGEYTAMFLSGMTDLATAVKLVRVRGQLMEQLVGKGYGMKALLFKPDNFDLVVDLAQRMGVLANINLENQVVLLGKLTELDKCIEQINKPKKVVLRAVQLPVLIPFHSEALAGVGDQLRPLMVAAQEQKIPLISNISGLPLTEAETTLEGALACNDSPVRWTDTMRYLESHEVENVINLGPGDVLQGLGKRYKFNNISVDLPESFDQLKKE